MYINAFRFVDAFLVLFSIFSNKNIGKAKFFFLATSFLLEETKQYLIRFPFLEIYENKVIKHNHRLLVKMLHPGKFPPYEKFFLAFYQRHAKAGLNSK